MDKDSTLTLNTGTNIPVLGLGTWQLESTPDTIVKALELGYRMIDTSSDYGSQPGIGEALKNSGVKRSEFYLVTKVEETDDSYERAISNLKELQLEYVDLLLIHRPPSEGSGKEMWKGLIQARDDGLTKDIGVSNYSISLINELIESSGEIPVVNQIEWSPFGHSMEMLSFAKEKDITIQAYSPLTRAKRLDNPSLSQIAEKYGKTSAQILLRWNLQLGTVPIPKSDKIEHLRENLKVFDFELSEEDMNNLNQLNEHYSSLGSLPYV
jgi:2,5-diketo-D-gluconate reductase A